MSNKALSKANRVIAGKTLVRTRQTRDHRVLIVSVALVLALSVGTLLATNFSITVLSRVLPQSSEPQSDTSVVRGDIVFEIDKSKHCRSFDNQTGQVTDSACKQKVDFYANGVPVPRGTIKRLDAISRSFSGQ